MIKILAGMNTIVIITALVFWIIGIKNIKNDEYNKKGIKYILGGTSVTGVCIILGAMLFFP